MSAEQERAPGATDAEGLNMYPLASKVTPEDTAEMRPEAEVTGKGYVLGIDSFYGTNLTDDAREALSHVVKAHHAARPGCQCDELSGESGIYYLCVKYAGIAAPRHFEPNSWTSCDNLLAFRVLESFSRTDPTARAVATRFAEEQSKQLFQRWKAER